MEDRSPKIFSPTFTRPYTYGLDIVSGYMTLMSKLGQEGVAGEAFNFGPYEQSGIPNALLATKICELWGSGVMWQRGSPRDEPFEYQSLSFDKSRERLGWRPAYTLDEALSATTLWYKEWAQTKHRANEGCMHDLNRSLLWEHRATASRLGIQWAIESTSHNCSLTRRM